MIATAFAPVREVRLAFTRLDALAKGHMRRYLDTGEKRWAEEASKARQRRDELHALLNPKWRER